MGRELDQISSIINYLFEIIRSLGYFGIMLGLMVEVIPSEIVLAYGGFLVSSGHINFFGAVVFGTIGGVLAQLFIYWIGRYGGRPVLDKYGKYILIKKVMSTMLKPGLTNTAQGSFSQLALFLLCVMPSQSLPGWLE